MGKKLGQHFLHSREVLAKIMREAAPGAGEPILEVGPGRGALTELLLAAGARVTAVEVDPSLCDGLRRRWGEHPAFRLIEGDIRKIDLAPAPLFGQGAPYAIVANLPYYLSTPFLFRIIRHRAHCARMVLMVQKEIAQRLTALPPDGKAYGSLSVAAHHAFTMRRCFTVPPGAFRPPPKVDSAVVAFAPRAPMLDPEHEARLLEHVKGLFTTRRKRMATGLKAAVAELPPERSEAVRAMVGERRAETLTPEEHLSVFRLLEGLGDG